MRWADGLGQELRSDSRMISLRPNLFRPSVAALAAANGKAFLRLSSVFALTVAMTFGWPGASGARSSKVETAVADPTAAAVSAFYLSRAHTPLWFGPASDGAAEQLLKLLASAEADGISKDKFQLGSLLIAIREASTGDPAAVNRTEIMLSEAFVAYARELQRDSQAGVIYVDPELKPMGSSVKSLLQAAAKAPSLAAYVSDLGWMNPLYGQLRQELVRQSAMDERQRYLLMLNLQRARALPPAADRYVLVNTANQRLYMYEDRKVVDEMKVVAGRANAQTPLMNAYIRFAVLNPYWNVPSDLTARLAPNVLERGMSYLDQQGYQVVADFSDRPRILDPGTIDWKAVAAGDLPVQLRQLPGPANSMGRIKFMFPNSQGVWLHDTPSRELFAKSVRLESAGCIRLEDAWRLGSWLFQRPLGPTSDEPERQLELHKPVPIYITYLTAIPGEKSVSYIDDVYRRDPPPADQVRYTSEGVGQPWFATGG